MFIPADLTFIFKLENGCNSLIYSIAIFEKTDIEMSNVNTMWMTRKKFYRFKISVNLNFILITWT